MKKGLRSRLAQYGDEEFALFLRRGFLKGAGFTDEALDRPIVGILSTASDFNPCHKTAPQVAEAISRGVRMAGALPFVFPTVSLHEAFFSADLVSSSLGFGPPVFAISAARLPVASANRQRSDETAGAVAEPGNMKPKVSAMQAMVEAVPMTMQVPEVGIS